MIVRPRFGVNAERPGFRTGLAPATAAKAGEGARLQRPLTRPAPARPHPWETPVHFHHHREPAGCTSDHTDWPDWAVVIIATLDRKAEQLMAAVQADLDAATAVITALDAKVADLEAQLAAAQQPALDSTALNAAVAAADALLNPPAPAPAPAPVGSVVDGGGAADTGGGVVDGGGAAPTVPSVPLA